ncbi:MAG: hypothetical protein AB7P23_13745, partial [Amphiplicatus sp.]
MSALASLNSVSLMIAAMDLRLANHWRRYLASSADALALSMAMNRVVQRYGNASALRLSKKPGSLA